MKKAIWTPDREYLLLEVVRSTGNISAGARAAGISRKALYERRRSDEAFAAALGEALDEALDDLEEELRRRAVEGVERPVFYGGKKCGAIRSYSDRLGMFLLKCHRGEEGLAGSASPRRSEAAEEDDAPRVSARETLMLRFSEMRARSDSLKEQPEA